MISCARGISLRRNASIASATSRRSPEVATMTGSSTTCAGDQRARPADNGIDHGNVCDHADLDRFDIEIGEHRIDLRSHEIRRHRMDTCNAERVLRRQRRNDRSAVDAKRRERLEISLDSRAAAGVGAGDGQCNGDRHPSSRAKARRPSDQANILFLARQEHGIKLTARAPTRPSFLLFPCMTGCPPCLKPLY